MKQSYGKRALGIFLLSLFFLAVVVSWSCAHAGAPVAWAAPRPVTVNVLPIAIASQAPHPSAAALFTDYLLSAEGQTLLKEQATPARPGIADSDSCVSQSSEVLVNDISMEERFNEVVGLYKKVFGLP
jgi:iron(III) transport system substrate-binding protein